MFSSPFVEFFARHIAFLFLFSTQILDGRAWTKVQKKIHQHTHTHTHKKKDTQQSSRMWARRRIIFSQNQNDMIIWLCSSINHITCFFVTSAVDDAAILAHNFSSLNFVIFATYWIGIEVKSVEFCSKSKDPAKTKRCHNYSSASNFNVEMKSKTLEWIQLTFQERTHT